jgi:hypothetical protein
MHRNTCRCWSHAASFLPQMGRPIDDSDEAARVLQIGEDQVTQRVWQKLHGPLGLGSSPRLGEPRRHTRTRPTGDGLGLGGDVCQADPNAEPVPCRKCTGACAGPQRCQSQSTPDCVCTASRIGIDRGDWVGSCGTLDASMRLLGSTFGRGKRSNEGAFGHDPLQCACNSSYVSVACCGSNDGLVWESKDLFLGELTKT